MVCQLTGMEVCNASHYDGSTALAEAVRMAQREAGMLVSRVWAGQYLGPETGFAP